MAFSAAFASPYFSRGKSRSTRSIQCCLTPHESWILSKFLNDQSSAAFRGFGAVFGEIAVSSSLLDRKHRCFTS